MTKPKAGDYALTAIILLIAIGNLLIFLPKTANSATALIMKDGKTIHKLKLDRIAEPIELKPEGKYNLLITAESGRIHFEHADCPDQVCVKTGWISRPGQSAACVPGGVIIKIIGDSNDTDIILK